MAKISTGPLAAGLSGKLGPVVFHQTRFGQVVQSKAKPRVYTTPAAMATKFAFGVAARSVSSLGSFTLTSLDSVFRTHRTTARGQVIRNVAAIVRGDPTLPGWPTHKVYFGGATPALGAPYEADGRLHIPYAGGWDSTLYGMLAMYHPTDGFIRATGLRDIFGVGELVTNTAPRTYPAAALVWRMNWGFHPTNLEFLSSPLGLLIPVTP